MRYKSEVGAVYYPHELSIRFAALKSTSTEDGACNSDKTTKK